MFARIISRKMVSISNKELLNEALYGVLYLLRLIILKFSDPIVCYKIGNFNLLMPFSHNLPLYIRSYPYYSSNLGRIAKLVNEKYNDLSIIDIGANVGDSVAIIKTEVDCPILCIEGNERFFKLCEKNTMCFSNVSLENAYIGNETEHTTLKIKDCGGTSHIYKDENKDKLNEIDIKALADVLKEHPIYLKSKLLKIDTDGFDCIILRGSIDHLSIAKPIVFFEYDPFFLSKQNDDGRSIFTLLSLIGYKVALIYDNFGDYMLSAELTNLYLLEDLHNYISNSGGKYYYDICVFHMEDAYLFEKIRLSEIKFFQKSTG
jgi:FkbM family methyltransferase